MTVPWRDPCYSNNDYYSINNDCHSMNNDCDCTLARSMFSQCARYTFAILTMSFTPRGARTWSNQFNKRNVHDDVALRPYVFTCPDEKWHGWYLKE